VTKLVTELVVTPIVGSPWVPSIFPRLREVVDFSELSITEDPRVSIILTGFSGSTGFDDLTRFGVSKITGSS